MLISVTSYGDRLKNLYNNLKESNLLDYNIVLTIYKSDVQNLTSELNELINCGKLKLIISEVNYKSHLKYFHAFKNYLNNEDIVTIDDDIIYPPQMIDEFIISSKHFPNTIICRSGQYITRDQNGIANIKGWLPLRCYNIPYITNKNVFAEGFGGIFYPKQSINVNDIEKDIYNCLYSDDILLKILANRNNIDVTFINVKELLIKDFKPDNSISKIENIQQFNDNYIKHYINEL